MRRAAPSATGLGHRARGRGRRRDRPLARDLDASRPGHRHQRHGRDRAQLRLRHLGHRHDRRRGHGPRRAADRQRRADRRHRAPPRATPSRATTTAWRSGGGDSTASSATCFGLRRDGTVVGQRSRVVVAGVASSPRHRSSTRRPTTSIGGQSNAASEGRASAPATATSSPARRSPASTSAAGASGESPGGRSTIAGNWIGLDADGDAASNVLGVKVGDGGKLVAPDTAGATIGGQTPRLRQPHLRQLDRHRPERRPGRADRVRTTSSASAPTRRRRSPNTTTNARAGRRLRRARRARRRATTSAQRAAGLVLTGPQPCVSGNFFTPFSGTYTQAAVILEANADDARIGNELGCVAGDFTPGNAFGDTAPGVPAILIRGADDFKVVSNFIGALPYAAAARRTRRCGSRTAPAEEPATGGRIGGDNPNHWNALIAPLRPGRGDRRPRDRDRRRRRRGHSGQRLRERLARCGPTCCRSPGSATPRAARTTGSSRRRSESRRPPASPAPASRGPRSACSSAGAPTTRPTGSTSPSTRATRSRRCRR